MGEDNKSLLDLVNDSGQPRQWEENNLSYTGGSKSVKTYIYLGLIVLIALSRIISALERAEFKTAPPIPQMPDIGIPDNEINSRFKLTAPEGWNTFKTGEVIGLSIAVISDDQIAFKTDGAKIFLLEKETWVEIPNFMNYPQGYDLLSPSKNDPFKQGATVVVPQIPDENGNALVRIILIGNIYRDGQITDELTAGYIDVKLTP
jgi:hypothetical protein